MVPIYNQEPYLRECLNSLLEQDCEDYEVILVDDGSTDGSAEICREYAEKYHFFRYIYQDNRGLGSARNTGLRYVKGTYILFLDSDDAIQKNSIGKLISFAEYNKADLVYFDEIVCSETLETLSVRRTYSEMDTRIVKRKALELSMDPAHVWARLYRRELFQNIYFENIWYEDMEIFPRLLMKAENLYYYKVPLYYYRQHKEGITCQEADKRNLDVIKAWGHVYVSRTSGDEEERRAVETAIKRSICIFIFYRPQFADTYIKFYNQTFKKTEKISETRHVADIDIQRMPLWQQAEFYECSHVLHVLTALQSLYQHGGVMRFLETGKICFEKAYVKEEIILVFKKDKDIRLREMRLKKGTWALLEVLKELSRWNLVSLKNQLKDFQIAKAVIEKTILDGIRIEMESV